MSGFVIAPDEPGRPDVLSLLQAHLEFCHAHSPQQDVHAPDVGGLSAPDIDFLSVLEEGALFGVGAIKRIDATHFEIKSMHTTAVARGRGVARTLVGHLVDLAARRGTTWISLETGSMAAFAPARGPLCLRRLRKCPPFSGYLASMNSVFMTLDLRPSRPTPEATDTRSCRSEQAGPGLWRGAPGNDVRRKHEGSSQ